MLNSIRNLGVLRSLLAALSVLLIAAAPFADGSLHISGWRFYPSVLAPSIMLLVLFILPLDITMTRVFMSDAPPLARRRYRFILRFEILLFTLLALTWLPFMLGVLDLWPLD